MADDMNAPDGATGEAVSDSPSMEDTMSAIYDKLQTSDSDEGQEAAPQENAEEALAEEPASEDEEPDEGVETEGDEPQPGSDEPLEAPSRWSEERKAKFAALPRDAQEILLEREREMDTGFQQKTQEIAEERKRFQQLDQVLTPIREPLQRAGVSEAEYVNRLVAADRMLSQDPAAALQKLAEGYGIDLRQLVSETDQQAQEPWAPLAKKIESLEQRLAREAQEKQQREAQESETAAVREIETFASEKDGKGELARPFFEDVSQDLLEILPGIRNANPSMSNREVLQKAYDKAVWSNPVTRQKLLDKQKADEKAQAEAKAKKAADKGAVNVRGKGGGQMKAKPRTIDETLSETYDKVTGAA